MRISLSWIKRLLQVPDLGLSTAALTERLTLQLAQIEAVETVGPAWQGVVVGKVLTCARHPQADRLSVTTVDVGGPEPLPIVCGAPNVAAGQTVAVATEGTVLALPGKDGTRSPVTIKKTRLRGEPSQGMICARDELGLGDDHSGIMVLDPALTAGTPLARALGLGDEVLVVDNVSINHRPDLWGHLGWAREIAAVCGLPPPPTPAAHAPLMGQDFTVELRDADCIAYCGAVITGLDNGPSPAWMQELLTACGLRPLGLLIDLTNYVMLELGEPMHAFDRRQIDGDRLIVRSAAPGETLTTLDGKTHHLQADDLLIADRCRGLALAGIMGGAGSMVAQDTTEIVLEAATFRAARIRRTRIRTGAATDSSVRFEKHLPSELTAAAINRFLDLLIRLRPQARCIGRFQAGQVYGLPVAVILAPDRAARTLGLPIPWDRQTALLSALGCTVQGQQISVPWWRRRDLTGPADLVEEVGRLHGYHHIQAEVPRLPAAAPAPNPLRDSEHHLRTRLVEAGWNEVATYAFTSPAWAQALAWPEATTLRLQHPLAEDQCLLRRSLLPTLAAAAGRNRRFQTEVRIFEIGRIYGMGIGATPTPDERTVIAGLCAADGPGLLEGSPFYAARDAALHALRSHGLPVELTPLDQSDPELSPGRAASLHLGRQLIGRVGELPAALLRQADLPGRAAYFCCDLELLVAAGPARPHHYQPPSRFPAVDRDFTFVTPRTCRFADLASTVRSAAAGLVRSIDLATAIYRGEGIPADHQAISLRVRLQADDRTLSEAELDKLQRRIVGAVTNQTGAVLRGDPGSKPDSPRK